MQSFFIIVLLFHQSISSYSQEKVQPNDSLNIEKKLENKSPLNNTNYKIPRNDFIVFNVEKKDGLYTGKIDFSTLQKSAQFALCCMGRIPPISVTYFYKGYTTGSIQVGSTNFAKGIRPVKLLSDTFNNLGDFEDKKTQVLLLKNTYILEEETIGFNKFIYVLIPDVDEANGDRLYDKLTDMKKKIYKGESADYYLRSFDRLEEPHTMSAYIDFNGHQVYRLKFYYYDLDKDIDIDKVFTKKDCKNILGLDYLLKLYSSIRNDEYILTWYQF
ncbi:MAG: hypothetical protein ABI266_02965 [Ginsengibacter sp.]